MKYTISKNKKASASSTLRISHKNAAEVCKVLNRKKLAEAKKILTDVLNQDSTIKRKYYSKTTDEILKVLKQLEFNARKKELDADNMFLFISAHRGPTMHRARRRWRKFGSRMKSCHIQAILSDKDGFGKKVRKRGNKK
jgi:ribosomal protein L22